MKGFTFKTELSALKLYIKKTNKMRKLQGAQKKLDQNYISNHLVWIWKQEWMQSEIFQNWYRTIVKYLQGDNNFHPRAWKDLNQIKNLYCHVSNSVQLSIEKYYIR